MSDDQGPPTPRELWGTCCPNDPECEHSFMDDDELTRYLNTPLARLARHKQVTCRRCKRSYECTPLDDYYDATTLDDGVCFTCLIAEKAPDLVGKPVVTLVAEGQASRVSNDTEPSEEVQS